VDKMFCDYERLKSVAKVGALYGRTRQAMWDIFKSRDLPLQKKVFKKKVWHNGVAYSMHYGYLCATSIERTPLHHVIWIKANGSIPRGHKLVFNDGNRQNFSLENIVCLTAADQVRHSNALAARNRREANHRRKGKPPRLSSELVDRMYKDYLRPLTLGAVGRLYGRDPRVIKGIFVRRGLALRPPQSRQRRRLANGRIPPVVPLTSSEITALIHKATKLTIPKALKQEWRSWPLERRGKFLARLRARLNLATDRPTTQFSDNVEAFDYSTPRAHEIAAEMSFAADSFRSFSARIRLCSQGVIWKSLLWFWSHKAGYQQGSWVPGVGKPSLHRAIWKDHHGRPVPPGLVVIFNDGNKNNLSPENLSLATKNDICRENQAAALLRKSRKLTTLFLNITQPKKDTKHDSTDMLKFLGAGRRPAKPRRAQR
jgi:hypothetical protein